MSIFEKIKEAWGKITVVSETEETPKEPLEVLEIPPKVEIPRIPTPLKISFPSFELSSREQKPTPTPSPELPQSPEPALQPESPPTKNESIQDTTTMPPLSTEPQKIDVALSNKGVILCLERKKVLTRTYPMRVLLASGVEIMLYRQRLGGVPRMGLGEFVTEDGKVMTVSKSTKLAPVGQREFFVDSQPVKKLKLLDNSHHWFYKWKTPEQVHVARGVYISKGHEKGKMSLGILKPELVNTLKVQHQCETRKQWVGGEY